MTVFDEMRAALGRCIFLPASWDKRFARALAEMPEDKITERQRRNVIRLAWKYRRQMPHDLVPSKDAVRAMDGERFPQPGRKDGEMPCGECHLKPGETCDICGATEPIDATPADQERMATAAIVRLQTGGKR